MTVVIIYDIIIVSTTRRIPGMEHTLELSKMISERTFDALIHSLKKCHFNRLAWTSNAYADKGIPMICLRKFKPRRRNDKGELVTLDNEPNMYMIILSINTGTMFGGDGFLSNDTSIFTPDFAKAIYANIFEEIPELEINPNYKEQGLQEYWDTGIVPPILEEYYELNSFKLRRIDFTLDIALSPQQYMQLIAFGKEPSRSTYQRKTFTQNDDGVDDDEPDFDDMEDILQEFTSDTKYIYYKSKSLNINIYLKGEQLKRYNKIDSDNTSYDFLRVEFQVKKGKLNTLNKKHGIRERCFHKMPIQIIEADILNYYIKQLTTTGTYVTYDTAMNIVATSAFKPSKKKRISRLLELIVQKNGIAELLKAVDDGTITELGKPSTVRTYLRDIQKLGINPVTLSAEMEIGIPNAKKVTSTDEQEDTIVLLPNLLDFINNI